MKGSACTLGIVIAARNEERYLAECLRSVLAAREVDRVVVIDDGSTDATGDVCEAFAKEDPRLSVWHTTGVGVAAARNLGIEYCETDYLMFVDGDDAVVPAGVQAAWAQVSGEDLCLTSMRRTDGQSVGEADDSFGERSRPLSTREVASSLMSLSPQSFGGGPMRIFYRRAFLIEHGILFPHGLTIAEDFAFNVRFLASEPACSYVPIVTYLYRIHRASTTRRYNPLLRFSLETVNAELAASAATMEAPEGDVAACRLNSALSMLENICHPQSPFGLRARLAEARDIARRYRNLSRTVPWARAWRESRHLFAAKLLVSRPLPAIVVCSVVGWWRNRRGASSR